MENQSLIILEHFFNVDTQIKKEMYEMVPPNNEQFLDDESICKYADKLNETIIYIFSELKCIARDVFGSDEIIFNSITNLENSVKTNFYNAGLDINKLRNFYKNFISDMNPKFIEDVKMNCVGYFLFNSTNIIKEASTINEMLHYMHSYIINNEKILQSIPIIAKHKREYEDIDLRGTKNDYFEMLFNNFPRDFDCGKTDAIIINENKMIMMVRDRGHALSIEITLNRNNARVEYFIPKLCNIDMINALPGINKVSKERDAINGCGTTGVFEIDKNQLLNYLYEFISRVPTDDDMNYVVGGR